MLFSLSTAYARHWSDEVEGLLLRPEGEGVSHSYVDGLAALAGTGLEADMLPLAVVDETSVACVALNDRDRFRRGDVVRYIRDDVSPEHQGALLDVDPLRYLTSLEEELAARDAGLRRVLDQIGPAYERSHLAKEKRPRDFVVRPVRIACQNVIVALAAIAHDATFDGLTVPAWQTCEVPHVATHEANRALAALTLCDAFQSGGTMEIRFDRRTRILHQGRPLDYSGHPEGAVPASLRRFGRSVGVALGAEDRAAVSPREARQLFLAITPMPADLRLRVADAIQNRGIAPERICFLLLSQVWREVELDWLLATTGRAPSILSGGADWRDRFARQFESEICRAAVMVGMLFRRLNSTDAVADDNATVRVVEDRTRGIRWEVRPEHAAVTFSGLDSADPIPWAFGGPGADHLTVFPRTAVTLDTLREIADAPVPGVKAVLVPADASVPSEGLSGPVLRCPDRLADVDKVIEDRLLSSRISRG